MKNPSEPNEQFLMQIDVFDDTSRSISPHIQSKAIKTLLMAEGAKMRTVNSWDTDAYESHEVMLNIDVIKIFTKTIKIYDDDLTRQIVV